MSQAIPLRQLSTSPTNVAIPTIPFIYLKGLHGNCMRHCRRTTSVMPAMLAMPGLSTSAHWPPKNSDLIPLPRARTHKTAPASSHGDRGRGRGWLSRRARRSAYSLTPPAVRPETMYFCRYWNSRITGMAAMTEPAAKILHGAVRSSDAHMYMPTARVNWL